MFNAVFFNRDYTPFSVRRDLSIKKVCARHGVHLEMYDDALLHPPGEVLKQGGGPYRRCGHAGA